MTYPQLALGLVAVAVVVRLVADVLARRSGHRIPLVPTVVAAVALTVLTAVFDYAMLAAGIDDYSRLHASGLTLGRAPIEDFSYPLAAAVLLPAVWELTRRRAAAPTAAPTTAPAAGPTARTADADHA